MEGGGWPSGVGARRLKREKKSCPLDFSRSPLVLYILTIGGGRTIWDGRFLGLRSGLSGMMSSSVCTLEASGMRAAAAGADEEEEEEEAMAADAAVANAAWVVARAATPAAAAAAAAAPRTAAGSMCGGVRAREG